MAHLAKGPVTAVLVGLCGGAALSFALAPMLQPILGDLPPNPWLIAASVPALALIGVASVALPSLKARKLQPAALLRQD